MMRRKNQSQPLVASMRARDGVAPAITRATATLQHRLQIENGSPQKAQEMGNKAGVGKESWGDDDPKDSLISGTGGGGGGSREGSLQSLVRRNNALILELMKLRDSNEKLRVGLYNSEKLLLTRAQSVALPIIPPVPASVIPASVKAPPSTMSASTQTEPPEESLPPFFNVAKVSTSEQACQTTQSGDRRKSGRKWDLIQPAASGMAESSDSSSQAVPPVARKVKFVNASPQRKSGLGPVLSEENEVNEELTLIMPSRIHLQTSGEHEIYSSPSCSPRSPFSPFFEGLSDTDDEDEAKSGGVDAAAVVLGRAPMSVSKLSPVPMSPVRTWGPTSQPRRSSSKSSGRSRGRRTHTPASASAPASAAASETHQASDEPPWSAGPGHYSPVPLSCDWLSPALAGQFGHTPVKAARKRRSQMVVRQDSLQALGRPPAGGARQGNTREGGGEDDKGGV